jgi:hypothetical protein
VWDLLSIVVILFYWDNILVSWLSENMINEICWYVSAWLLEESDLMEKAVQLRNTISKCILE